MNLMVTDRYGLETKRWEDEAKRRDNAAYGRVSILYNSADFFLLSSKQ